MPGQLENRMGVGAKTHAITTGALSVTDFAKFGMHIFSTGTAGGSTLAVPDGTHKGERLSLKADTINSTSQTMVATPANFMDGTTITFDASNEYADLQWTGTEWAVMSTNATVA